MTASEVTEVMDSLKEDGRLPAALPKSSVDAITKSLTRYFGQVSADKIQQFSDKAREVVEQALKTEQEVRPGLARTVTTGGSQATGRGLLGSFIESYGVENIGETMGLDFFLRVATEVASGAAQFVAQNFDQDRLDEFPALELVRVYPRDVPRGSAKDPAGPENGWEGGRWEAACDESGDDDAAQAFADSGRMVALKSSGVWQALGDGAGGYDDTLGNPFAPFGYNSGMDTNEVSRAETITLGLMDDGDTAEPAKVDFSDLLHFE